MAYVKVFYNDRTPTVTQINNRAEWQCCTISNWCLEIGGTGGLFVCDGGLVIPLLKINISQLSRDEFTRLRRQFRGLWASYRNSGGFRKLVKHPMYSFRPSVDKYDIRNRRNWLLVKSENCWSSWNLQNVNGFIFDKVGNLLDSPRHYDLQLLNDSIFYLHNMGQHISASRLEHLTVCEVVNNGI